MGAVFVDNNENFLFKDNTRDGTVFRKDTNVLTSKGLLRLLGNLDLAVPRLSASSDGDDRRPRGSRQNDVKARHHDTSSAVGADTQNGKVGRHRQGLSRHTEQRKQL